MSSFGENLRRERELRGASLRDIADATKISTRFLEALEQDRLDVLPGGIYPRAFVRQYARYLGLDADRLTAEFVYAHRSTPEPAGPRASSARVWPRVGAVLLAAIVVVALWLVPGLRRRSAAPEPAPVVRPSAVASPADEPVESVYATPEPTLEPAAAEGLVLTLSAQQDCWVGVETDGRSVLNRVLTAGESETLRADSEIVLSVGNAGGISFTLNDQPGVSLGNSGEVRHHIVITPQTAASFVTGSPVRGS